jgi:hypothetical protein
MVRAEGETNWLDLGNVTEGNINVTADELIHELSRSGLKVEDRNATTKLSAGGTVTVDVVSLDNIMLFIQGNTKADLSQTSGNIAAQDFVMNFNRWTYLEKRDITSITVEDAGQTVTYVENVDYVLDRQSGDVAPIEGGGISDGDTVKITATFGALTRTKISAGEVANVKRHFRYEGNPSEGQVQTIQGFVNFRANGDYSLIGSEWKTMSMNIKFELHPDYDDLYEVIDNGVK